MALYCQWMLQIAVELAREDDAYADMALKFISHFQWIAIAMNPPQGDAQLWDEQDGFYYDVMRTADGNAIPLRVRSLVGLLPLCAATVFDSSMIDRNPEFIGRLHRVAEQFSDVAGYAHVPEPNARGHRLVSLVGEDRLRRILAAMLDEEEFLGPHGIRAISRRHLDEPCVFDWAGQEYRVSYLPAESDSGMFGGNSNWRGPVWFPMNLVILRALLQLHRYYGDEFTIECPTGSGRELTLEQVAGVIGHRLTKTFTRGKDGKRPVYGGDGEVPDRPALARPDPVPRVLPRRQRRRDRGEPPDRLDRHGGAALRDRGRAALVIYEVNTAVWLGGRRLDEVSWESVALPGVEAVWLMGVWERSPAGLAIARDDPGWRRATAPRCPTCATRT